MVEIPENIKTLIEQAKTNPYAFGAAPSRVDTKDYQAKPRVPASLPASYSLGGLGRLPVSNQIGGTCTGHAVGIGVSYLQYAESGKIAIFDGEEVHNRFVHHLDFGAMPKDIMEEVRTSGASAQEGLYFIGSYGYLNNQDFEAMKACLASNRPLVIAAWLTREFVDAWGLTTQKVLHDAPGEDFGYHAIAGVGYTPDGVIIQNSWGRNYGFQGTIVLGWDYLATHVGEMWVMTDKPDVGVGEDSGFVRHYFSPIVTNPDGSTRSARRGGMPHVWALYEGGRMWIQSRSHADRMGIDLTKTENLPATDDVWNLPIVGKVPPA